MCCPASAASCLPTAVEPVKEILRITGCGIRYSEISAGHAVDEADHAGGDAGIGEGLDRARRARPGVSSGALTMIEQPAASAADSLRTTWLIGKFHGVKAATGPTGCFIAICVTPPARAGMIRP